MTAPLAAAGLAAVTAGAVLAAAAPAAAQVDSARASAWFDEAAVLCAAEGGRLWGMSLCGPMVFADAATGTIAANRPAPDAPRPRVLGYANAALEWGDERWATFIWRVIPADDGDRARLMIHELFHRIQPALGLYVSTSEGENEHLDTPEGRYWLQLEWRALAAALGTSGDEIADALRDALTFRHERRASVPGAAERERISEINEGLAQYTATAVVASGPSGAAADAVAQLTAAPVKESYVRTFAYASGAAYGILLDALDPGWTRRVRATDDLGRLAREAAGIETLGDPAAAARRHDGAGLWAAEQEREARRLTRVAALRARFVEGPVLVLPRGRNASFITTGVTPIPGAGTIYPRFRVSGDWGSIEADQVLMSSDGGTITVPGPFETDGPSITGEGWTVRLEPGWTVGPGQRAGDYVVRRSGD